MKKGEKTVIAVSIILGALILGIFISSFNDIINLTPGDECLYDWDCNEGEYCDQSDPDNFHCEPEFTSIVDCSSIDPNSGMCSGQECEGSDDFGDFVGECGLGPFGMDCRCKRLPNECDGLDELACGGECNGIDNNGEFSGTCLYFESTESCTCNRVGECSGLDGDSCAGTACTSEGLSGSCWSVSNNCVCIIGQSPDQFPPAGCSTTPTIEYCGCLSNCLDFDPYIDWNENVGPELCDFIDSQPNCVATKYYDINAMPVPRTIPPIYFPGQDPSISGQEPPRQI